MALTMKERVSTTPVSNNCFTLRLGKTFKLHLNTCTYVTHEEHLYFKAVSIVLFRTVKTVSASLPGVLKFARLVKMYETQDPEIAAMSAKLKSLLLPPLSTPPIGGAIPAS